MGIQRTASNINSKTTKEPKPTSQTTTKGSHSATVNPSVTLGHSAGIPGETSKYRNRVRTSSLEIKSHHLHEPRRRNSATLQQIAVDGDQSASTPTRHRSSTLSTTLQASSSSRPLLRSRASTNTRSSPPVSPTLSTHSSLSSSASAKGRPRAMSSSPRTGRQTQPYRKLIIIFSILVSLFLLGTVIVLSSVRYYLAIPDGSFLTEEEVPWTGSDLISPLRDPLPANATLAKRQDWEEVQAEGAVMGAETIPQVWDEMSEEDMEDPVTPGMSASSETYTTSEEAQLAGEEQWGIDGPGSGQYWMQSEWDGHVRDTDDWSRLYNVSLRYVCCPFCLYLVLTCRTGEKIPRIIHQTWKDDQLPEKWRKAWKECREGMPD